MDELKPCPFCGRIPVVDDCGDHQFFVRCECGINQDKLYSQKCDAIRSWNRRKNMDDLISRQSAIDALGEEPMVWDERVDEYAMGQREQWRSDRLSIEALPSAEKKGKWIEKHHEYADEGSVIDEWQSCKCSICGRYDTRPYMYYFDEPRFCSWCGADMRGEEDE